MKSKLDGGKLQKNDRLLAGWLLGLATVLLLGAAGNLYVGSFQDDGSGRTSIPYSDITGTPTVPSLPVSIPNGGTGQTTAPAALTALGGFALSGGNTAAGNNRFTGSNNIANTASLRLDGTVYVNNGYGTGSQIVFPDAATPGTDQTLSLSGSTNGTGAGLNFWMLTTNNDSTLSFSPLGYPGFFGPQLIMPPMNHNIDLLCPGVFLGPIANSTPFGTAKAYGYGNQYAWLAVGNGVSDDDQFVIPYADGVHVHPLTYHIRNNGTNVFTENNDGEDFCLYIDQTTGAMKIGSHSTLTLSNAAVANASGTVIISSSGFAQSAHFDGTQTVSEKNFLAQNAGLNPLAYDASGGGGNASGLGYQVAAASVPISYLTTKSAAYIAGTDGADGWLTNVSQLIMGGTPADVTNTGSAGPMTAAINLYGSVSYKIVYKTASYLMTANDYMVFISGVGNTITLPDASSHCAGREYLVKDAGVSASTVATQGSQTIDGSATFALTGANKYVGVISNGTNWFIVQNN